MYTIQFKENMLTADDVLHFQETMGWNVESREQWEKSLEHTLYAVSACCGDELVGMGRLLGDGVMYWYINDVFVLTNYQGQGIGREIVLRLLEYVKKHRIQDTDVSVFLMSAKGKEGFYEKLGFRRRPSAFAGHGMELEL